MVKTTKRGPGNPGVSEEKRLDKLIFVKITASERLALDKLMQTRQWRSRSQIMRAALRQWLEKNGPDA